MKKIIVAAMLVFALVLGACGGVESVQDRTDTLAGIPLTDIPTEEIKDERLTKRFTLETEKIIIDLPGNEYTDTQYGNSRILFPTVKDNEGFVAYSVTLGKGVYDVLYEAANGTNKQFESDYDEIVEIGELQFRMDEDATINGIECVRFMGHYYPEYEESLGVMYTYGYTFIHNGVACSIRGLAYGVDKEAELDMHSVVDAMMESVILQVEAEQI